MGIYDSGGIGAQFVKLNQEYEGEVIAFRETQQKDMETGKLITWDSGEPKMMGVWTIDTEGKSTGKWEDRTGDGDWVHVDVEDDDSVRTIYASSGLHTAIAAALRKAKARESDFIGGRLRVKFIRTEKAQTKGWRPRKIFEAEFTKGDGKSSGVYADNGPVEDDDFSV